MSDLVVLLPDERAERFISRLKLLQQSGDVEVAHLEADQALCELLLELNFGDVVDEWHKVTKWYA